MDRRLQLLFDRLQWHRYRHVYGVTSRPRRRIFQRQREDTRRAVNGADAYTRGNVRYQVPVALCLRSWRDHADVALVKASTDGALVPPLFTHPLTQLVFPVVGDDDLIARP